MKRSGFTLIEVLIVVVILAILAAAIVPQFQNSTNDAKVATTVHNLMVLRSQIQAYRAQHNGSVPSQSLVELTTATSRSGGAPSGTDSYGPYITALPENTLVGSSAVGTGVSSTPAVIAGGSGWGYHAASGTIWINHADYLTK